MQVLCLKPWSDVVTFSASFRRQGQLLKRTQRANCFLSLPQNIPSFGDINRASPADRHSELHDRGGTEPSVRWAALSRGAHSHAAPAHEGSARRRPKWLQQVHGIPDCLLLELFNSFLIILHSIMSTNIFSISTDHIPVYCNICDPCAFGGLFVCPSRKNWLDWG